MRFQALGERQTSTRLADGEWRVLGLEQALGERQTSTRVADGEWRVLGLAERSCRVLGARTPLGKR